MVSYKKNRVDEGRRNDFQSGGSLSLRTEIILIFNTRGVKINVGRNVRNGIQ